MRELACDSYLTLTTITIIFNENSIEIYYNSHLTYRYSHTICFEVCSCPVFITNFYHTLTH